MGSGQEWAESMIDSSSVANESGAAELPKIDEALDDDWSSCSTRHTTTGECDLSPP